MKRTAAGMASLVLAVCASAAERLEVSFVDTNVLESRLAQGATSHEQREATIAEMFQSAGCEVELQKVNRKNNNVICTLKGSGEEQIVVGGHYDFATEGKGIVDDWSGASLLVSLYDALKSGPRRHTYKFVAFAKEEEGLEGSRKYVHDLDKEQRRAIRAFINLECLGTTPLKVWASRATPELLERLARVSASLHQRVEGMNVDRVGDDDSHPFLNAGIPVLTLHSLDNRTIRLIHSPSDRLDAIHADEYAAAYRLIAVLLAYLDSNSTSHAGPK